jgi:hypothetical protein
MHFLGVKVKDNALILLADKASVLLPVPFVIAVAFSLRSQPTHATAVTLSAPAATADIKNKLAPSAVDLT